MAARRLHSYKLHLEWTGNRGSGTASYTDYSRNHQVSAPGKSLTLALSSDAAFRGDADRYSPEELLLASLSSCHMLWLLHLCANAGVVVTAYTDTPEGRMAENMDGSGQFTAVTLRPRLELLDPSRAGELEDLHHRAHELCFVARSVNFPVSVAPEVADRRDLVKTL